MCNTKDEVWVFWAPGSAENVARVLQGVRQLYQLAPDPEKFSPHMVAHFPPLVGIKYPELLTDLWRHPAFDNQ